MGFVAVFVGAGIGGALRHGVNLISVQLLGASFPFGTLFINVCGSLLIGMVAEYGVAKSGLPQSVRLLLVTGFLGGFTTFSSFSIETAMLWERGNVLYAAIYVIASVFLSISALFVGLWLVRSICQ